MTKKSKGKEFTKQEIAFINAIAEGRKVKESCDNAGISRTTGWSWKKRPEIKEAIAEATEAILSKTREEELSSSESESSISTSAIRTFKAEHTKVILPAIARQMEEATSTALATYVQIMEHGKYDRDKIAAADRIIKLAGITEQYIETLQAENTSSRKGLSEETVKQIYKNVLGVDME